MKNITQNESVECYSEFEKVFVDIINEHGPFKKKFLSDNHAFYMTKGLAIMKRSKLKSKYLKIQIQKLFKSYKKQRNFRRRLYKKERKKSNVCNSIDFENIYDNRRFWKTVNLSYQVKVHNAHK